MNFLLFKMIHFIFDLIQLSIIVRVILSWIPHNPSGDFVKILYQFTELILKPIRDNIPVNSIGVDFSPIIAFVLLGFIKKIILAAV